MRIMWRTIFKVSAKEDIATGGMATALDYGDWLLDNGMISREEYDVKQKEALKLLQDFCG